MLAGLDKALLYFDWLTQEFYSLQPIIIDTNDLCIINKNNKYSLVVQLDDLDTVCSDVAAISLQRCSTSTNTEKTYCNRMS